MEPEPLIPARLVCLASGSGRTVENFYEKICAGVLPASIALVITSSVKAGIAERCKRLKIPLLVINPRRYPSTQAYADALLGATLEARPDWVILAGWLRLFPIPSQLEGRVLNIHPALLPAYGGKGYYGHHVHEAVAKDSCTHSGCTVHFATEEYDAGPIVLQEVVTLPKGSTPEEIATLVFEAEKRAYPAALRALIEETAYWEDGKVYWGSN